MFKLAIALLLTIIHLLSFAASKEFIVAKNNGSMMIGFSEIYNGIYIDDNNYFISTLNPDNVTPNFNSPYFFYEVKMGDYTDYYIPVIDEYNDVALPSYVFVLSMYIIVPNKGECRVYTYSSISPLDVNFNGYSILVPYDGAVTMYGGTQLGAPSDGRLYGSAWGGMDAGPRVGGCCRSKKTQTNTVHWGQPYVITAIEFDPNYVYLRIINAPSIVFSGQTVGVTASLIDIFMRNSLGIKPTWTLSYKGKTEGIKEGDLNTGMELKEPITEGMAPIHHVVTIDKKGFWPDNGTTKESNFIVSKFANILAPSTVLNFGSNITRMLRYSNLTYASDVMTANYAEEYYARTANWFGENENNLKPVLNENMTAIGVDDYVNKGKIYNWKWIEANSASGLFGNSVDAINSYQYFAFAVFSIVPQNVRFTVTCPKPSSKWLYSTCITYVDGYSFENAIHNDDFVSSFENEVFLSEGWHQFLAKVVTEDVIPADQGYSISFSASGLATYDNMLHDYPYNSTNPVNPSESTSKKLSIGAIVGIVIACVVVFVAIALILKFTLFRRPSINTKEKESS